jgi:hypothetical protein
MNSILEEITEPVQCSMKSIGGEQRLKIPNIFHKAIEG